VKPQCSINFLSLLLYMQFLIRYELGCINKHFIEFLNQHQKWHKLVKERILGYNNAFFRTLHKVIANVPPFKKLSQMVIRTIALNMIKIKVLEGDKIINFKEKWDSFFFVYSGEVIVNVINQKTNEKIPFSVLTSGCSFNFYNSILNYESIFEFEALTHWSLL